MKKFIIKSNLKQLLNDIESTDLSYNWKKYYNYFINDVTDIEKDNK